MSRAEKQWIRLARILRPQGRKGEVLADLYTDFPEQFASQASLSLAPDGFTDSSAAIENPTQPQPVQLVAHWLPVGRNAGRIVLQFAGISSIEQAEALAGREVVVLASDRRPLEEGSVYVSDLVGATVYDRERPIGVVTEVLFPATPDGSRRSDEAAPLLSVTSDEGDEILIPFVSDYLESIDVSAAVLRMKLPEGLVEINRTDRTGPKPE